MALKDSGIYATLQKAQVRHVAINALRNDKTDKKGVKAKRFKATLVPDYAEKILNDIKLSVGY